MDPRHARHPSASIPHLFAVDRRADELDNDDERLDVDECARLYALEERRDAPLDDLAARVGGAEVLRRLDVEPIPDEPFDWSAVEELDRPFVAKVLELTDRYCDDMLDAEFRTITRRLVAKVARRDPRPLRRSTNVERCAAGFVWLAGNASGEFGRRGSHTSRRLWGWFGVANASDRGYSLRKAAGLFPDVITVDWRDEVSLGDASLLHSRYRAQLVASRDLFVDVARRSQNVHVSSDGRTAEVRARPTSFVVAAKGVVADGTRTMVVIGLGDDLESAGFFAFSVPEARDLVARVQGALDTPPPSAEVR